jgi:acetolactate synthase I/II/III large subunit
MKLSDYVIDFLARRGVTHVFGISGGAAVHLFESVSQHPDMHYVCPQHEQSAAMAADGYARLTGRLGVAMSTSGPGATNLLTGVCCSFYDSVPTMMITGQVATHRLKGARKVRQVGFQETDVMSIYSSVTKYACQISDPHSIRYHLEKAYHLAFEGRPGTVLIDLPDDLQRAEVDPLAMRGFDPGLAAKPARLADDITTLIRLLSKASRPVLVLGGGLKTPPVGPDLDRLLTRLNVPALLTWAGVDLLAADHPLRVGPFGVYGPRLGNFAVQNADFILCLGTRLSQNLTGGILPAFARAATIAMVDICRGEMDKFDGRGIHIALRIESRLCEFIAALLNRLDQYAAPDYAPWKAQLQHWRQALPNDRPAPAPEQAGFVDAYDLVEHLSNHLPPGEVIFVDTGGNLTWTCNGLRLRPGQRLISAWNNTPMGYSLPAAIGAACHKEAKPLTCIIGDGGLMLCLSELATVARHQLPIRIILFNNHGHGIQRQTLETWLDGHYVGADEASGLAFADFSRVAAAMGLPTVTIDRQSTIAQTLRDVYAAPGPILCDVEINPLQKLYPVLKFGSPLEEQMPLMNPARSQAEMLIPPFDPTAVAMSDATVGV